LPAAARRQRPGLRRHQFPAWHPVATEEPAWLTRLASDAEVMLSRASAAARAMSAWVRVQQEARDGAADVPPAEQNKALEAWPRRRRRR